MTDDQDRMSAGLVIVCEPEKPAEQGLDTDRPEVISSCFVSPHAGVVSRMNTDA